MREDAAMKLLEKMGEGRPLLERLMREGAINRVEYDGETFYLRNLEEPGFK